ncbi:hypothetical protein EC973_000561 [Apophysomyces ossiformis]|uniref:Late endosomal/lysosomal adaptor and MAPK and MTOR activator 1 n=1 Tax=Apophysomyces ossiformis TaxID=679940 RepID=A0A8H7EP44_9FUNG|nr:hypothetical protein EC973_000561 [Apophysomyces ossiformis]
MGCCGSKEDRYEDDLCSPLLRHNLTHEDSNLIDISNTTSDPLQTQDIQERVEKYKELLNQLVVPSPPKNGLHNNDSPIDILLGAEPDEGVDLDWLYRSMDEIQIALDRVQVEYVDDIVVNLTLNENTSTIRAY